MRRPKIKPNNRGIDYRRIKVSPNNCKWNRLERGFAASWERINRPVTGINHGQGILQDLFTSAHYYNTGARRRLKGVPYLITNRERMIVATVIQWLGTSCGFSWFSDVLRSCGYRIIPIEKEHKE